MPESVDCVIVGGGIGGVVLALILGKRGKHVVLLERELRPHSAGRPEILAQSTIDVFRELGVVECILKEAALPLDGLELHDSTKKLLLHFSAEDFKAARVQPYSTDPTQTRAILLQKAETTHSVEVNRGVEVKELIFEGGRVRGVRATSGDSTLEWRAPLVVGDDGGQSRIRKSLKIPLKIREFPFEFLGAAGPELPGTKERVGEAWIEPGGLKNGIFGAIFMPQPGRRTAFVFILTPESRARSMKGVPSDFYDCLKRLSPRCEGIETRYSFPKDFTVFRRPFGHAPCYVADGAALLGDAAHPVTPAGGQGANMSVADAVTLGEVALEAFQKSDFSARHLAHYETKRRRANERSLQFSVWSSRVFRTLQIFPGGAFLLPWFLQKVERNSKMKRQFIQNVSNAFRSHED